MNSTPGTSAAVIRLATVADLDRICEVDSTVFREMAYPRFVLRQLYDVHHDLFQVIELDGVVRGYALAGMETDRSRAWLLGLGLEESCRGMGMGRDLLTHAIDRCRDTGVPELLITVRPTNQAAYNLYKRAGFREIKDMREENYFGASEPRSVLRLNLTRTAPR